MTIDQTDLDDPDEDLVEDGISDDSPGDDPFLEHHDDGPTSVNRYWDGDRGELDLASRKALQALLKWPFISAHRYPSEWKAFLEHRAEITSRLNDLLLELHVDLERGVAYKRQAPSDGAGQFTTLLYDKKWSREETILIVHLRGLMRATTSAGHLHTVVERSELLEHIAALRPGSTGLSEDRKAGNNAISAVHAAGLLVGPKDGDRFEVDPAVEVLLPLETLIQLKSWIEDPAPAAADELVSNELTDDGSTLQ